MNSVDKPQVVKMGILRKFKLKTNASSGALYSIVSDYFVMRIYSQRSQIGERMLGVWKTEGHTHKKAKMVLVAFWLGAQHYGVRSAWDET